MEHPPLPPLPDEADRPEVRRAVVLCGEEVGARLDSGAVHAEWLDRWSAGTLDRPSVVLEGLLTIVFPEGGGEPDLEPALTIMRGLGEDRARMHMARDDGVRLVMYATREMLWLLDSGIRRHLPGDLADAVMRRMHRVGDLLVTEYLVAFLEESESIAAEHGVLADHLLHTTKAGFANADGTGVITYANDAFAHYFPNPVGRAWEDVLAVDDAADLVHQALGGEVSREIGVTDVLGDDRTVRVSLHPRGGRLHAVAVDVTLEAEYARMHREFVAGLIHDLRSPLAVIAGWTHTLATDGARLDPLTRDEALTTINRAALQLTRMSENLLEISLLEANVDNLQPEAIDAAARLRALTESTPLASVEGPEELGVMADADAFERMLTNLIDNAATYGQPPVEVRLVGEGAGVRIDVVDHGSIDPAVLESAETGRVGSAGGFGLGLRTTLLLARAQGGDLELTSDAPTTFTLRLPSGNALGTSP